MELEQVRQRWKMDLLAIAMLQGIMKLNQKSVNLNLIFNNLHSKAKMFSGSGLLVLVLVLLLIVLTIIL